MAYYIERLGRTFEALQLLDLFPAGVDIADLASYLGCDVEELRDELKLYNEGSELGPGDGVAFVEFLAAMPTTEELTDEFFVTPEAATAVRLSGADPTRAGGGLSLADLGTILMAAEDLLTAEPDNQALAAVVATLRSRWLPGVAEPGVSSREHGFVSELSDAIEQRRRVRIGYQRVWEPGTIDRVIEPFALERTRRGFEVDAGLVGEVGSVRTYLVPFIRRLEVLDETFERPADAADLCRAHRSTTRARIVVPSDREWVVELLAERVEEQRRDDDLLLEVDLLEPRRQRVGLLLVQAGPDAFVLEPDELRDAGEEYARTLAVHHGLL
ncbi:MAG: hypothetical protein RLZ55_96 [Actinomycetota bacterium]|jgi:proteasome accessory factor C